MEPAKAADVIGQESENPREEIPISDSNRTMELAGVRREIQTSSEEPETRTGI